MHLIGVCAAASHLQMHNCTPWGQTSPGELQLPTWTLTTGLNMRPPSGFPPFSAPNPPPPTVQTGQYRAAAGLASGESSTSSGASIRAEVQQPASSQPGHRSSPNYSFLQALDTGPGIGDTRREKEDTDTKDLWWGHQAHREDTFWTQKSRLGKYSTRESFDIFRSEGEAAEETYWSYKRQPEVLSEVSELGREGALGGRMSTRSFVFFIQEQRQRQKQRQGERVGALGDFR